MTVFKDIVSGRKYTKGSEEKIAWTKVGTLIEKDGKQYVKLEAFPLPNEKGEVFLSVFEQRSAEGGARNTQGDDMNDSVPF